MKTLPFPVIEQINQKMRKKGDVELIMQLDAVLDHPLNDQEKALRAIVASLKDQKSNPQKD